MVTETVQSRRNDWLIPGTAQQEWLRLAGIVESAGPVLCQTSDPEAWWPDRLKVDELPARMALDACSVCPAREPCAAYAVAADARDGIWGGLLPAERRAHRFPAAGAA